MIDAQQNGLTNNPLFDTNLQTFDEVLPEPIRISLIEYREEKMGEDENGAPLMRRKPVARIAEINTYVPMKVFHSMISSQERLRQFTIIRAQAAKGQQLTENQQEAMLEWMTDQVVNVWRLTEPWITADKIKEGLSFQKVFALFNIFFGDLLKSLGDKKA